MLPIQWVFFLPRLTGFLLFFSGTVLLGQSEAAVFRHLGSESGGFTDDLITVMYKGRHGFMWFGTGRGLIRYDGRKIRWYRHDPEEDRSISNNNIRVIYEGPSGQLWIGTNIGLNLMDRKQGRFTRVQPEPQDGFSLAQSNIWSLFEDGDGALWVGTDQGLWRLAAGEASRYTAAEGLSGIGITSIVADAQGTFWVGTDHSGINRLKQSSGQFEPVSGTEGLEIRGLRTGQDGSVWAGTANDGLWYMPPGEHAWSRAIAIDGENGIGAALNAFELDAGGEIWVGTLGGLHRMTWPQTTKRSFRHRPDDQTSLNDDGILAVYADDSGLLWIASQTGGVDLYDSHTERFTYFEFSGSQARALHQDPDGRIWVGGRRGLQLLDEVTGETVRFLENANIRSVASSDGFLYAGTDDGLQRMPAGGGPAVSLVSGYRIWQILPDGKEGLWLGTNKGLLRYGDKEDDIERFRVEPGQPDTLSHKVVTALAADRRGFLWVGTYGGGLNRLDKQTRRFKRYPGAPDEPNGLSAADVVDLCLDSKDRLWVATQSGGFNRLDQDSGHFIRYTTREGLPDNVVVSLVPDEQNRIWMSTSEGLVRFDPETEQWVIYRLEDGVIVGGAVPGACLRAADGALFLGGTGGLVWFHPQRLSPGAPPAIVFTDLVAGRGLSRDLLLPGETVELGPQENTFSLTFSVLDFRSPNRQQFAFQRGHIDEEWVGSDTHNFISYTEYLPYGGQGALRVKGRDARGSWNEAQLRLVVQRPPWLKWLPLIGVLVVGALIWVVYLVSTYREKRKRAALEIVARLAEEKRVLAEERARIALLEKDIERTLQIERAAILQEHLEQISTEVANDLHDGPLAELQGFGFRLGALEEGVIGQEHKQALEKLTDQALPGLCDSLRNICSDLLAPDFRFGLRAELDAHADIVEGRNPDLHILRHFDIPEGALEARAMAALFRIYRTLLKNVVVHARAKQVEVSLQGREGTLELVVADDGVGFQVVQDWEELKRNKHYGMFMAHYFAETIGGTLAVDSAPGKGTRVSVTLPLEGGLQS